MKTTYSKLNPPYEIHLIGCGGVGSWVLPALIQIAKSSYIYLWDGDILELRNLDRQLFEFDDIGKNKATALVDRYSPENVTELQAKEEYFHEGSEVGERSLILCCADNHAARRAALMKADETGSTVIIAGNEYTDADAYIYVPGLMRGGPNDPRVFAPEILTDRTGDPRQPAGCTGVAALERPQLVLANMAASIHMLRLMWWWFAETENLSVDTRPFWPVMHKTTASRSFTTLLNERVAKEQEAV